MVDYSKWDNLDVSDDSDAEPQRSSSSSKTNTAAPSSGSSQAPTTTTSKPDNARYISQALAVAGMAPRQTNPDPPTQEAESDEERPRLSPTLQEYANIHPTNYRSSHEFLTSHPSLIDKSTNSDGLLMKEAFLLALQLEDTDEDPVIRALKAKEEGGKAWAEQTETEKNEIKEVVKQCVHQALLLQYCRLVSPDGKDQSAIGGFFMRLIMPGGYGGSAGKQEEEGGRQRELLMADVETRAGEIIELAREARAEQLREQLTVMMLQGKA
ncbi:hypothetical protein V8F06_003349 [Rhypophila decipiens]